MLYGKCFTAGFGTTAAQILAVKGSSFGGGVRASVYVRPQYCERFFAVFANATYIGTFWCDISGVFNLTLPPSIGTVSSLFIEDVGMISGFDSDSLPYIAWHAKKQDALTANRLGLEWDNGNAYNLSTVQGDTQVTSITITGAVRGVNVEEVPDFLSRGRLYYTLSYASGVGYFVRWWNGTKLVAEGFDASSGATITCNEVNQSGISVACTFAYTSEVKLGTAWIDLKWAASYQIHYSTSALVFPRTPEDTVQDNGSQLYSYLSAALNPGVYNFNIVPVDDEGDVLGAPSTPADSPVTIRSVPTKPTITSVTGNAASGLTVNFSNGESGCTYKLYYNQPFAPINFGTFSAGPTPVGPSAVDATSLTTAAITGYTALDHTSAFNTCKTAFDSAVATANTAFNAGPPFTTDFATLETAILAAIDALGTTLGFGFREIREQITAAADSTDQYLQSISSLTGTEWLTQAGQYYGAFLRTLGSLLEDNPTRYYLPNGALAGSVRGGETTGTSSDGQLGEEMVRIGTTLYTACLPLVKPAVIRLIVRATKSSVEELNGAVYDVELDNSGNIVSARPGKADIISKSISGLTLTVAAEIIEENVAASADYLDLYVYTGTISLGSANASLTLPTTGVNGQRRGTFSGVTVGASGWYKVAVLARTASGVRSEKYDEQLVYISNDTPQQLASIKGYAVRSRGR
jgi:hypothetical protein